MSEIKATLEEIADQLNNELGLEGPPQAITRDIVRRWVRWRFVERAAARGQSIGKPPDWRRTDADLDRARRLAQLHVGGLRGERELICQGWLEHWQINLDRVRSAFQKEFDAALRYATKNYTSDFDPRTKKQVSEAKIRSITHQLGPQANVFKNSAFRLNESATVGFWSAGRFGVESKVDVTALYHQFCETMFGSEAAAMAIPEIEFLASSNYGLMGETDEIADSAKASLSEATPTEFELARAYWTSEIDLFRAFSDPAVRRILLSALPSFSYELQLYELVVSQLAAGRWAVLEFARLLHAIHKNRADLPSLEKRLIQTNDMICRFREFANRTDYTNV